MAGLFDESSAFDDGNFDVMADLESELKLDQHQLHLHQQQHPTQEASPSALMSGAAGSNFTFSRASSIGSVNCSSASSTHNSEDDDSDSGTMAAVSYKDRRREAHTHAEQKRRDAIKRGYEELQSIVPTCQLSPDSVGSQKHSKATILQKSIEYTQHLIDQKTTQEKKLEELRKEVMALKIMKSNLEQIVKAHQSKPQHGHNQLSDEAKFKVFQQIMDALFVSFDGSISVASFSELSGSVFSWLEEYCKPQTLQELTMGILRRSDLSVTRP